MSSHGSWLYPASGQLSRNSNFRVAPNDNEMILRAWICWSIGDKFESFWVSCCPAVAKPTLKQLLVVSVPA